MQKKTIIFIAALLVFLDFLCWKEVFALILDNNLKVDFFEVGQGDAVFIETPEMHQILIDGGPDSTVLKKLSDVMPFWDKTIDLVILTHPEKDHMAGILSVMQRYKIDYFLWTGVVKDDAENKKLTNLLESQQINVVTASSGQRIKAGDVFIDILYPFNNLAGQEMKNTSNDAGVVNKIIYGKDSFLFTGDISSTVEKKLVNSGENIKSDVLKVAHHGSKYSTSDLFLKNVKPEYAVIEVGKNSYGHPTPEVLNRLKNFGIKVFNTYIDGDVEFISDGKTIQKL